MRITTDLLARFVDRTGRIERPVVTEGWIRPDSVSVIDGYLVFDYHEPIQQIRPGTGMMRGFLQLRGAADERIASYARRWGALSKSPIDRNSGERMDRDKGVASLSPNLWDISHGSTESLAMWRATSERVYALLARAAELEAMMERSRRIKPSGEDRRYVSRLWRDLQVEMNIMSSAYGVRPFIAWTGERWALRVQIGSLGGAIFVELMLMLAGKEGLALCGSCGAPFETDGKRKIYCESCGRPAAQRAASKKLYEKKRSIRIRHGNGEAPEDIARDLGQPVHKIKRWLKIPKN